MTRHTRSRREFMGLTGAGLAAAAGGRWPVTAEAAAAVAEPQDADLVVFNAKVYTVDAAMPRAEAFRGQGRPLPRRRQHRRHEGARRARTRRRSTPSR